MDTLQAIDSRRSIRKYTADKITDKQLEIILKAAMQAPSAVNQQPWHFIIIKNQDALNRIAKLHPNADFAKNSALTIVVCGDPKLETHIQGLWPQDLSAASQNILLSAHAQGLGGCWCAIYGRPEIEKIFKKEFNLPSDIEPFALIPLGYPEKEAQITDRFNLQRIHHDSW